MFPLLRSALSRFLRPSLRSVFRSALRPVMFCPAFALRPALRPVLRSALPLALRPVPRSALCSALRHAFALRCGVPCLNCLPYLLCLTAWGHLKGQNICQSEHSYI